jgi:hypothetical protein
VKSLDNKLNTDRANRVVRDAAPFDDDSNDEVRRWQSRAEKRDNRKERRLPKKGHGFTQVN